MNTGRNFHVFHYAYSFPYRCAISRLGAQSKEDDRNAASIEDGSLRNPVHLKLRPNTTANILMGAGKFWSEVSGETTRSRQFIPLEFCQNPSVLRIGYNEKCQTRDRESLRSVGEDRRLGIVMAIRFRVIEGDVDSLCMDWQIVIIPIDLRRWNLAWL